jgi:AraC family transcriptional regulator of adaptative response/methylated-DNA-[protein]-cysteine methyltransferase
MKKETLRRRIRPVERCGEAPAHLRWVEWTADDEGQPIRYSFFDTPADRLLIADTAKGICFLGFVRDGAGDAGTLEDLRRRFPRQPLTETPTDAQKAAAEAAAGSRPAAIALHLKGTPFQLDIWKKLTRIPSGALCAYGGLSDTPKAARAVGAAVGANPVSVLVPCHRVVRRDGGFGGYHWGTEIKERLLARELR